MALPTHKPEVLVLCPEPPWPVRNGWSSRNSQVIMALAQFSECDVLCLEAAGADDDETIRKQLGARSFRSVPFTPPSRRLSGLKSLVSGRPMGAILYYSASFEEAIRHRSAEVKYESALILGDVCMGGYVSALRTRNVTLDMCDDLAGNYHRRALSKHGAARVYFQLQASVIRRWLQRTAPSFQAVLAVSSGDRDALAGQVPCEVITVPLGVDTDVFSVAPSRKTGDGNDLLFVGAMRSWPNRDAAEWFAAAVLPLILRAEPAARLRIVGSGADQLTVKHDAITLQGFCEDLAAQYRSCSIFVCPLRVGTGIKNKMLEAMACGCAIVATSIGVEGLSVSPGVDVLVADDAPAFAEAVVRLVRDPVLRQSMGAAARSFAEQHLSLQVVRETLEQAILTPHTPIVGGD